MENRDRASSHSAAGARHAGAESGAPSRIVGASGPSFSAPSLRRSLGGVVAAGLVLLAAMPGPARAFWPESAWPQSLVDAGSAPESPASRTVNLTGSGSCYCDMRVGACDFNCFCDPDCGGEARDGPSPPLPPLPPGPPASETGPPAPSPAPRSVQGQRLRPRPEAPRGPPRPRARLLRGPERCAGRQPEREPGRRRDGQQAGRRVRHVLAAPLHRQRQQPLPRRLLPGPPRPPGEGPGPLAPAPPPPGPGPGPGTPRPGPGPPRRRRTRTARSLRRWRGRAAPSPATAPATRTRSPPSTSPGAPCTRPTPRRRRRAAS